MDGAGSMHEQVIAEEDRATPVVPIIRPAIAWRVGRVSARPHHRLSVVFLDGLTGTVGLSTLIDSPQAGVFAALRDDATFAAVHVAHGAVTWPGDLDLAPDAMHAAIARDGEWRPS